MRRKSERNKDKEKEKEKEKPKPVPEKPKRGRPAKRRKKSSSEEERDSAGEQGGAPAESPPQLDDQVWHVKASDSSADCGEIQKLKLCLARPAGEASPRGRKPLDRSSSRSDASETSDDKKRGRHRSRRSSARDHDKHKDDDDDGPTTRSALKRDSPLPEDAEEPSSPPSIAKEPEKVASEVATSSSQDIEEDNPPEEVKCDTTESPETSPDSTVDVKPIQQEPEPSTPDSVVESNKETECEAEPVIETKPEQVQIKEPELEKVSVEQPKSETPEKVEESTEKVEQVSDKVEESTEKVEQVSDKVEESTEKVEQVSDKAEVAEVKETVMEVVEETVKAEPEPEPAPAPEKIDAPAPEKITDVVDKIKETKVVEEIKPESDKVETEVVKKIEPEPQPPPKEAVEIVEKIEAESKPEPEPIPKKIEKIEVVKKVDTKTPEKVVEKIEIIKKVDTKTPEKVVEKIEVVKKVDSKTPEKVVEKIEVVKKVDIKTPEKVIEKIEVVKKVDIKTPEKVIEKMEVDEKVEPPVVKESKPNVEKVEKPVEKVKVSESKVDVKKPKEKESPKKEITKELPKTSTKTEAKINNVHTETATTTTAARKRKWGSRPKLSKSNSVNISTDSLKNIISNVEPVSVDEVLFDVKSSKESEPKHKKAMVELDNKKANGKYSVPEMAPERETVGNLSHRKISIVNEEASKLQRSPSPPKFRASSILYITNLVRPFTLPLLKNLLQRTGRIVENGFWIDKIKSKCYVEYETEDEAIETRHALHGVTWPFSNPKTLNVDFGSREAMEEAMATTDEEKSGYMDARSKDALNKDRKIGGIDSDEKVLEKRTVVREWDLGKGEGREEYLDRPNIRQRDGLEPERKKRRSKSRSPSPARKFKKKEEEAPSKLLDDLFKKTKTTPCIYWLPLDPEVILIKEEQRRKHMAEHERRFEELRKAEEQRMTNRHAHHSNRHR